MHPVSACPRLFRCGALIGIAGHGRVDMLRRLALGSLAASSAPMSLLRLQFKFLLAALLFSCGPCFAQAALAMATIIDGEGVLIRESSRYTLAEGVRLTAADIVETGATSRFVRIEFNDGYILDLGDDTRVMLAPQVLPYRSRGAVRAYVLRGWVKWTSPAATTDGALLSSLVDAAAVSRHGVMRIDGSDAAVFAESGDVMLTERPGQTAVNPVTLKNETYFGRSPDARPVLNGRPPTSFLERMPRAFRDTLPRRAELFRTKDTQTRFVATITYSDVQPWIDAEPALRRQFVERWRTSAANAEFRRGLLANMKAHPEWQRVLFPPRPTLKPTGHH